MPELRASLVLDANAQDLDREVRRATRLVDRFGREVRSSAGAQRDSARSTERQSAALRRYARRAHQAARSTRRLDLATQRLDTGLGRLAPLAAGAGLALLGRAALGTIQSFESLRATLETFSDSQRQAAERWEVLSRYARRTPFELEDVVRAYGVLVSRGLEPTTQQFETLAEIAAGSSRTYVQFAEAVADAVQGETERLKEFGIRLQLDGERARLSFRDTRLEVARTGPAILAALEEIARLEFGGAVERQARTLGGALSTLRGNLSEVSDAVGRGGLAAELNVLARGWAETADGTRETAREFGALAGLAVRHADTIGLVAGGYVAYRINLALAARAQVFYARALGDSSRGLRGYLGSAAPRLPAHGRVRGRGPERGASRGSVRRGGHRPGAGRLGDPGLRGARGDTPLARGAGRNRALAGAAGPRRPGGAGRADPGPLSRRLRRRSEGASSWTACESEDPRGIASCSGCVSRSTGSSSPALPPPWPSRAVASVRPRTTSRRRARGPTATRPRSPRSRRSWRATSTSARPRSRRANAPASDSCRPSAPARSRCKRCWTRP